ncbi:MAG: heme lyase CcmF/NrfE family subunit [Alphaproteobacteria bacterium]|nr:heme lyase CcmF/NrfE family subunit [Alphaproteobacteria bacterium]
MIAELGQLCLVLTLLVSLLQAGVPLLQRLHRPYPLLHLVKPTAALLLLLLSGAFAALIYAYVVSDFSVLTVILNSHSSKPMLYKIVGAWGNHEGSMLLWMWVLAACGFLVAYMPARDAQLKAATLAVLGLISSGFMAFILFTSNPFLRVFPAPADGEDLNPILQDIGLAFHPPTLYVGYVGFGVVFAYAIAGMLLKRIDSDWARAVHPWILLPWTFLTLGIAAGSWWAYRELGWGGWWFWDPVENVALLPWLAGTALIHSNRVLERRGQLARWVALLAILAFTLSLIGTFIVRSGLITSVHAFAADPARGMFILGYIVLVSGAALLVYGAAEMKTGKPVALLSRSGFILINNLLLLVAAAIILLAILYPLALELLKLPAISVGPEYFNRTFLPIAAPLPILAALAPLMAWDKTSPAQLKSLLRQLAPALLVGLVVALALLTPPHALLALGMAMAAWLLYGSLRYVGRVRAAQVRLLSRVGLRHLAGATAHTGLALFVLGMALTATLKQTYDTPLTAAAPMVMGDYSLRLIAADRREENNFIRRRATLEVARGGHVVTTLAPELRYYPVRTTQTAEAALYSTPLHDIYVVLGETSYAEKSEQARLGVRMYVTPGQQVVWLGFILAALGGILGIIASIPRKGDA